jgi:hypothetical protein
MKARCGLEIQRYTHRFTSISDSKESTLSERIRTEYSCIQLWEQIQLTCLQGVEVSGGVKRKEWLRADFCNRL